MLHVTVSERRTTRFFPPFWTSSGLAPLAGVPYGDRASFEPASVSDAVEIVSSPDSIRRSASSSGNVSADVARADGPVSGF